MRCSDRSPETGREIAMNHDVSGNELKRLLTDVFTGIPVSLLVSPAAKRHFGDYRKLLGWFADKGVRGFYDVVKYADITVWAYSRFLADKQRQSWIASPCPAVNRHVVQQVPELRKRILPVLSPVITAAVYLRKYRHVEERFAFITPCLHKQAEIEAYGREKSGIEYCVTIRELQSYLLKNPAAFSAVASTDFTDQGQWPAGQLFGGVGGIGDSLKVMMPELRFLRASGPQEVYPLLEKQRNGGDAVDLLELNHCRNGCDSGAGIGPAWPFPQQQEAFRHSAETNLDGDEAVSFASHEGLRPEDFFWREHFESAELSNHGKGGFRGEYGGHGENSHQGS